MRISTLTQNTSGTKEKMSQFNKFSELPQELQDQIWDLAIRDDRPAAHFFTVYDPAQDCDDIVRHEKRVHVARAGHVPPYGVGLAAPEVPETCRQSWTDGNLSAYMTDSALWTACWNSRKRMLWHFRPTATRSLAVTMPFLRDDGKRQYLTIRPSEDLLCLQFPTGSAIREQKRYWRLLRDFPLLRSRLSHGWWQLPERVRHLAIDLLDMEWFQTLFADWPYLHLLNVDGMASAGLAGFWLINYGLDRRYRADGDRRGRRTFRAAGGVELVEVLADDNEWWDRSSGPERSLARRLTQYMADLNERTVGWKKVARITQEFQYEHQFGVLACVKPGSEKHLPTKSEWNDALDPSNILCASMQSVSIQDSSES